MKGEERMKEMPNEKWQMEMTAGCDQLLIASNQRLATNN